MRAKAAGGRRTGNERCHPAAPFQCVHAAMLINPLGLVGLRRYAAAVMALPFALASAAPASASDAELQDALRRARCGSPTIKQLSQLGSVTVYEANCFRSSHRVITVTCTARTCTVQEPEGEERDPE